MLLGTRDNLVIILVGLTASAGALFRARQILRDWRRLETSIPAEGPRL